MEQSFRSELLEKLVPWANKPICEHAITALTAGMDNASKAKLRSTLKDCWALAKTPIDHRSTGLPAASLNFAQQIHFVACCALDEFKRLSKLYEQQYTVGLKQSLDEFVAEYHRQSTVEQSCLISGWRLGASRVRDFRRRDGERLILQSRVKVNAIQKYYRANTSNISSGGCLLSFVPGECPSTEINDIVEVDFIELAKKYGLILKPVMYQVVVIEPLALTEQLALKRIDSDQQSQFDQLMGHLVNEHKRRNRLDVDNTVKALTARSHHLAAVAQLTAMMVLSHQKNRYHVLVTQGQSLHLQAQLLIDGHLLPWMVENTTTGKCQLFITWANSQNRVFVAELSLLARLKLTEPVIAAWRDAPWHKAFLVKSGALNPQLADLGTSLPCEVAPIVSKLNAPLPAKVAQLSQDLAKISLIEDLTYLVDAMVIPRLTANVDEVILNQFRLNDAQGVLRQVPFDSKEQPYFNDTFRFSHDGVLNAQHNAFVIVNGYADYEQAVVSVSLKKTVLAANEPVKITWLVEQTNISLKAAVIDYDIEHKTLRLKWRANPKFVRHLFDELNQLEAFNLAFQEDLQAEKLDFAMRNLILCNQPILTVFAQVKPSRILLTGLTGQQYVPQPFIDSQQKVKLDRFFSQSILAQLALCEGQLKEVLFVALKDGEVVERHLLSHWHCQAMMLADLHRLNMTTQLFIFILDIGSYQAPSEDPIIKIEQKYLDHYNPSKAKKLRGDLKYNMSIQLVNVTDVVGSFMGW